MLKADPPPATPGATQPETRYSYTPLYAYYKNSSGSIVAGPSPIDLLTGVSTCQTEAPSACPGTADEVKTTFAYGSSGVANNLLTTSIAKGAGNGSLTATTSMSYDDFGNVASITGPLGAGQTTAFFYDADRRETGFIGPNPGGSEGLAYPAVHYLYVPDGMRYETDVGTDTSQSDSSFATFTLDKKTVATFDGIDEPSK